MGLFSGIGSFFSGVCSCIGGAISGVASALSGALGLAGTLISGVVCGIIKGIAAILGIGKENEKPEELGLKAEKAERNLEEFDSFEEYKEYLDGIELTDEDLEKLNDPEKKEAYTMVGTGVYLQGINEHYGMNITPETFVKLANLGVKNPEDAKVFLDKCKEKGISPDLDGLANGKLTINEEGKLVDTLKSSIDEMSNKDSISAKLDDMLEKL